MKKTIEQRKARTAGEKAANVAMAMTHHHTKEQRQNEAVERLNDEV